MASRAELVFKEIVEAGDPIAHINKMIADKIEEEDYLEFKIGEPRDADTKNIWSKSLSAFGNTEGGVLIWGIQTAHGKGQPDVATKYVPVLNAREFRVMLEACRIHMSEPPLSGVQIKSFPDDGTSGFVVCFIPEGADKPYRASKYHAYYHRNGANSLAVSHSMLRAMFYPRVEPLLELEWVDCGMAPSGPITDSYTVHVQPHVSNSGHATAIDPVMLVRVQGHPSVVLPKAPYRFEHAIHPMEPPVPTPMIKLTSPVGYRMLFSAVLYAKDAKPRGYRAMFDPHFRKFTQQGTFDPTIPDEANIDFCGD